MQTRRTGAAFALAVFSVPFVRGRWPGSDSSLRVTMTSHLVVRRGFVRVLGFVEQHAGDFAAGEAEFDEIEAVGAADSRRVAGRGRRSSQSDKSPVRLSAMA